MTAYPPPPGQPEYQPAGGQYPPPPPGAAQTPPPPPPNFAPQQSAPWPAQPGQSPVPPPPPGTAPVAKAPPAAWLLPLAALLAIIGAVTPWFRPQVSIRGRTIQAQDTLYSIKDGKIGIIAPIVLTVLAFMAIGLLRGKVRGRLAGASDPVRSVGKYAVIAGVVSAVCLLIAWFLVTTQYKFGGASWSDFEKQVNAAGGSLGRGPQVGYWLTAAAALVAIAGGVVMLLQAKSEQSGPQLAPTSLQKPPPPPA